jgi:hypothetical protein
MFSDGIERQVLRGATKTANDLFLDRMIAPMRA